MFTAAPPASELSDAWIEGEEGARWRTTAGHGPDSGARASGSSVLEVDPGCRLPRHTDSAEETIVVVSGRASVLRFVAVYASTDVTTTYEDDVQPDGGRERDPVG